MKLIEAQQFYQTRVSEGTTVCQLLHLPRFFSVYKPRYVSMTEVIVEYLKGQPNHLASYEQVRALFDESTRPYYRHLLKHAVFTKVIKTEQVSPSDFSFRQQRVLSAFCDSQKVPYRTCFPNAPEKEWKTKYDEERRLNVCRLKDPNASIDDDDKDENDEEKMFLNESNTVLERPLLCQVYDYIRESKEEGVSEPEVGARFGLGRIKRRGLLKQMMQHLDFYISSSGRQKMRK